MKQTSVKPEDREAALLREISLKEEQIEASLQTARREAAQSLDQAKKDAQENLEQALQKAGQEAEVYKKSRRSGILTAQEKLLKDAKSKEELIHEQAKKNKDKAVDFILSQVLPKSRENTRILSEAAP